MKRLPLIFVACLLALGGGCAAAPIPRLTPFSAAPDQVLVIYNADGTIDPSGHSTSLASREVAQYYVARHTDPQTGKKPHLLGLTCRHPGARHLNHWFIKEKSNDNGYGILFKGKGKPPDKLQWVRDSRKVEIHVTEGDADWDSVKIAVRSEATGEETLVTPLRRNLLVAGIPARMSDDASYPAVEAGKGRSFRFNAADLYRGTVTVAFSVRDTGGKPLRELNLRYFDARDFVFSPTGADGIPDDLVLEEDVLQPVRAYLENPAHALPDGTPLKDHILYLLVVHGVPYSGQGVFGIAHGVTGSWGEHGTLTSLEQRLQTLYYAWDKVRPPLIPLYQSRGPESDKGVVNHTITTALRRPLTGSRWNPYMHPDTYSFLAKNAKPPQFIDLPPLGAQRRTINPAFFAYAVSRIDGTSPEEAKRLVDYALYASKYLRPEMDCAAREEWFPLIRASLADLLQAAEEKNLWGREEVAILGFPLKDSEGGQGVPLLVRPGGDGSDACDGKSRDWQKTGFYPGGIERNVYSGNGLNKKDAKVWHYLAQGVTVTAAGSPASGGGPHITNTTFWDNRILLKYLFRGRDLGECFLRATPHVNWSTALIGDPLFHPDLNRTVIDRTPPRSSRGLSVEWTATPAGAIATVATELDDLPGEPEVALLQVTCTAADGTETRAVSPLYGRRPAVTIKDLPSGVAYGFRAELVDPYGNRTLLPAVKSAAP